MNHTKKKVTLQTIADELGISKYAVSLALNGRPGVSDELREKVIATAQNMNYEKLHQMVDRKNKNILVLIPAYIRNDMSFYNAVYWAIEKESAEQGYNAILTSVNPEMEEQLQLPTVFEDVGCIGIIAVGIFAEPYAKMLTELGKPLVLLDQYYNSIQIDSVMAANEEGAYQAVDYLIQQGHRDIGFVGSITMASSIYERWFGYYKAMAAHGLTIPEAHCITDPSPLSVLLHDEQVLDTYLSKMESFPTAWFCAGDMVAIAMMKALKKRGLSVPDDISIASFDDIEMAKMVVPNLTTYNAPRNLMGINAVQLLLRKAETNIHPRKITLYGELAIRDSVKPILALG